MANNLATIDDPQARLASLEQLVSDILGESRAKGASAAEAAVSTDSGLSATVRLGEVETVEHHRDKSAAVTVYFGKRKGSASTSDFSPEAVRETVAAACAIARYTAEDDYAGLADAELMAGVIPELDLYHPWSVDAEQAIEIAKEAEAAGRADTRVTNSEGATVSTNQGARVYGNSHGFVGGYAATRHSNSCVLIAQDGEDNMQRDYWYTVSRDAAGLEAPRAVGEHAARRTLQRLGARRVATCQVPVIFAAEIAGGLLGNFVGAVRGGSLYRNASFLVDHLGKQIFPEFIRIHEQPHLKRALGSAPFDNEGVATRARDIVTGGVLESYVLDSYSARKLGMQTTGNAGGVHNLRIDSGPLDLEGLVKEMGRGLLVTELMGMGVNMVTGDYSRGAAGYWVEHGEIQYPVQEITIAGNLRDMFMNIQAVGKDVDTRGNIHTGSLLLDNMTVAGT